MKDLIDCAMKREKCDLVVRGASVLNVFTGELEKADVAVKGGKIAAIGQGYEGGAVFDAEGLIVLPGLMDGLIHVASSPLSPAAFAQLAVSPGTTGIVPAPH